MNIRHVDILTRAPSADRASAALRVLAGALALALATRVSLPLHPVPVTAQTLAVLLLGVWLGPRQAVLSVLTFLAAGAAGLPVFAMGGGPAYLLGPTGGYMIGFVPAAYLAGIFAQRGWGRRVRTALAAMTLADAVLFACGVLWLTTLMPPRRALVHGLLVFVPGECLKIALAAAALHRPR